MKTLLIAVFTFATITLPVPADEFVDDFSDATLKGRLAERGEWNFKNGEVSCVADPELYRKFKNHGPILKWPREFVDGTIEFEVKPKDCQRVVFTLNGDGHIFRVILGDSVPSKESGLSKVPSRIICWASKSSKKNKGDAIKPKGLKGLPTLNAKWTKVKLVVKAGVADLKIGEFGTTVKHAALAREKNIVTMSFASGELAMRAFRITAAN